MANSLSNLVPTMYEALDIVSRELVGFIPAVGRDTQAAQGAVGQIVRSPTVPTMTASDITPNNVSATGADRNIGNIDITIQKARKVTFHLTGEQNLSLKQNNAAIARDSFTQAMRALTNEIEADLAALYIGCSRAYGTPGTTPFGVAGDLSDFAQSAKVLDDNGAPRVGRQMVLGTAGMANLRGKQNVLFKINEAGTDDLLRNGIVGRVQGFDLHDSAKVMTSTKGTGASYVTNGALAVGATTIPVQTGTGTIVVGDVITFAADTVNKYVVAQALTGGNVVIAAPGLMAPIPSGNAVTVANNAAMNMAFTPNAFQLATRTPAIPDDGDNADDRVYIEDPVSGMVYEVAVYRQYRQVSYEVGIAWGVKAIKPEHAMILLG